MSEPVWVVGPLWEGEVDGEKVRVEVVGSHDSNPYPMISRWQQYPGGQWGWLATDGESDYFIDWQTAGTIARELRARDEALAALRAAVRSMLYDSWADYVHDKPTGNRVVDGERFNAMVALLPAGEPAATPRCAVCKRSPSDHEQLDHQYVPADEPAEAALSSQERAALDALALAMNRYASLPIQHPSDAGDFAAAIHDCQRIVATRVARRVDPDAWLVKEEP